MLARDALDPIRSLKAVLRAGLPNAAPLLGWWFGGLAALFAAYLVIYLPTVLLFAATMHANGRPEPAAFVLLGGGILLLVVVMIVLQCAWRLGFANLLGDALRTGRCEFGAGFRLRGRLLPTIGALLLVAGIVLLTYLPVLAVLFGVALAVQGGDVPPALIVLAVPLYAAWLVAVVWLSLGFVFSPYAAAFEGCGALEAVQRSWALARGRRFAIFVFFLVTALCAMAGIVLCCVGYLATAALVELMPIEAYLALTRGDEYERWWVQTGRAPADDSASPTTPAGT